MIDEKHSMKCPGCGRTTSHHIVFDDSKLGVKRLGRCLQKCECMACGHNYHPGIVHLMDKLGISLNQLSTETNKDKAEEWANPNGDFFRT